MKTTTARSVLVWVFWVIGLGMSPVEAFNGHRVEEGPFSLEISPIQSPESLDTAVDVPVVLHGPATRVTLRLQGLVDHWYTVDAAERTFTLETGTEAQHTFRIAVSNEVYRALYPVHVTADITGRDGTHHSLHAIRVFESALEQRPERATEHQGPIPFLHRLALLQIPAQFTWHYFDQAAVSHPRGWLGQDPTSRMYVANYPVDRGGQRRPSLTMHPPWHGGRGTVFADYWVTLPETLPLTLTFGNAIRDHAESEPASDGVTFRVWIGDQTVYEHHSDHKTWVDREVDLSPWAGQTVHLRLESHPGPDRNTVCDSSYWAEPTIWAGPRTQPRSEEAWQSALGRARTLLLSPQPTLRDHEQLFDLGPDHRAVYLVDPRGPDQAVLGFRAGDRTVLFRGFELHVNGQAVGIPAPGSPHRFADAGGPYSLHLTMTADRGALRVQARTSDDRRITDFALGPADQGARQVYFGHGYVIRDPEPFRISFGGHSLASSHVGVDFDQGVSLLTASDVPPVAFEVDPDRRRYSLHTRYNATLILLPGDHGALDTAIRYHPLYDKPAAPGVPDKAGRFVFDIWGGHYREHLDLMRQAVAYGLTDTLLTVHVWQRWGYDYRLPDIYPPAPDLGTIEDLQALSAYCREQGIPWGLHDNYIDFYPDAEDYSYDHICFTPDGQPIKAWINTYREAQSYRWRPDRFLPFLKRNLDQILPALKPSHSFVDVFTSIPPIEFHDRAGDFHSAVETREHWGEMFDVIRAGLQAPAITTSEAGHDQLTGHLDGADCQFLRLSPTPQKHTLRLSCRDWERVPWFDAVLHDRFILHGVGYSGRYQGGRSRERHGIDSDDYLTAELLTGHALMTDLTAGLSGAVRAYWLAQPVARALALDTLRFAEWENDNIHRQHLHWNNGMRVWVNRGTNDWAVAGRILPPMGALAWDDRVEMAIERIGPHIVEQSAWPRGFYVNSRTDHHHTYRITPAAASFEVTGPRQFRLPLQWRAEQALPREASVFIHFLASEKDDDRIAFQGDHRPEVSPTTWQGTLVTGTRHNLRVPDQLEDGSYLVVAGLFTPGGRRWPLQGDDLDDLRYRIGTLVLEGEDLHFEPHTYPPPPPRNNLPGTLIDFGRVVTDGAFRVTVEPDHLLLTPLPEAPAMQVQLRTGRCCPGRRVTAITAIHPDGTDGDTLDWTEQDGDVSFTTRPGPFAYRLTTAPSGPVLR